MTDDVVGTDIDWHLPPQSETHKEPIWVNMRIDLVNCSAIDTVACTSHIKIYVIQYWTDSRLAGWSSPELPSALWGPQLTLDNVASNGDLQDTHAVFDLVDRALGRLKRVRLISATIDNPMHLRDFPLDIDDIRITLSTTSTFLLLDESKSGEIPVGKTYRLRPVPKDGSEGNFLHMWWDGTIAEWALHGVSTRIVEHPAAAVGYEKTDVNISFHVSRKSSYYFHKALLPLYLLMLLSFNTFAFDTDDLSNRNSSIQTCFLAGYAMLYVVGAALPKTDFLTKIDKLIMASTLSLSLIGVACRLLYHIHVTLGNEKLAERLNWVVEAGIIMGYVVTNVVVFFPALLRKVRAERLLRYRAEGEDLPPTVQPEFTYEPLTTLKKPNWWSASQAKAQIPGTHRNAKVHDTY